MSSELIQAIIEYNKIGTFLKLDPYSENRSRAKYARVCVNVPNAPRFKSYVILPNLDNSKEKKVLTVWYEDPSKGCGNCGEETHVFDACPLRNPINRVMKVVIEKRESMAANAGKESSASEQVKEKAVEEEWIDVSDPKGKKPMIDKYKPKSNRRCPRQAGGGLKIWDIETEGPRKGKGNAGREDLKTKAKGKSVIQKGISGDIIPSKSAISNAIAPSKISGNTLVWSNQHYSQSTTAHADMAGLDASLYDFCGDIPLGSIQEEGGYLLQDVIRSCGSRKDLVIVNLDGENGEDMDVSYKSTHSRTLMVMKMTNMSVKKDEMSISDKGKRKLNDGDDDMAFSSVKRHKNVDP